MNNNLNILVTVAEDGRWDDKDWIAEQESISAMNDLIDNNYWNMDRV